MKVPWKLIVLFAAIVTAAVSVFDLFFAIEGDSTLEQYKVEAIEPTVGEDVLKHLAEVGQDTIFVRSGDIGAE